mmetsp:Transcript_65208/g.123473  ORF Transcript_65208/g.123473 Transcript_65208/m.123473 type:complete len:282 (+) Transcript_65208:168-1013(+)
MSPAKKTGTSVDVISFCQKLLEDASLCVRIISCWERLSVGNRLRRIDVIFRCCLQTKQRFLIMDRLLHCLLLQCGCTHKLTGTSSSTGGSIRAACTGAGILPQICWTCIITSSTRIRGYCAAAAMIRVHVVQLLSLLLLSLFLFPVLAFTLIPILFLLLVLLFPPLFPFLSLLFHLPFLFILLSPLFSVLLMQGFLLPLLLQIHLVSGVFAFVRYFFFGLVILFALQVTFSTRTCAQSAQNVQKGARNQFQLQMMLPGANGKLPYNLALCLPVVVLDILEL